MTFILSTDSSLRLSVCIFCFSPLVVLMVFHCICSSISIFFLNWEAWNWKSTPDTSSWERRERRELMTSFTLLTTVFVTYWRKCSHCAACSVIIMMVMAIMMSLWLVYGIFILLLVIKIFLSLSRNWTILWMKHVL